MGFTPYRQYSSHFILEFTSELLLNSSQYVYMCILYKINCLKITKHREFGRKFIYLIVKIALFRLFILCLCKLWINTILCQVLFRFGSVVLQIHRFFWRFLCLCFVLSVDVTDLVEMQVFKRSRNYFFFIFCFISPV